MINPEINDLVKIHESEDIGGGHNYYRIVKVIPVDDDTVYLCKTSWGRYEALTHSSFCPSQYRDKPDAEKINYENKDFVITDNDKSYSKVLIHPANNLYIISKAPKASDSVVEDIKDIVNKLVSEDNIMEMIDKAFTIKISWDNKKGDYVCARL
jgi:hypothetical protein